MAKWTLYYNPKCSKCREALALLQSRQIEPEIIEYLRTPPSETELKSLVRKLKEPLSSLVRVKEEDYQNLKFNLDSETDVVKNLAKHPNLIERPIVIKDERAVIARPVEKIEQLF